MCRLLLGRRCLGERRRDGLSPPPPHRGGTGDLLLGHEREGLPLSRHKRLRMSDLFGCLPPKLCGMVCCADRRSEHQGDYFASLNASVRTLVDGVAHSAGGMLQGSMDGYLCLSLNRKRLFGALTLYPELDWSTVTLGQLREVSPDRGEHLSCFPHEWIAQEASRLVFSRPDWGLLISMYACLWAPTVAKGNTEALQRQLEAEGVCGHLRS